VTSSGEDYNNFHKRRNCLRLQVFFDSVYRFIFLTIILCDYPQDGAH
jgi:hypothetical protein